MNTNYFPLGTAEDHRFFRYLRILFGIVCLGLAAYWLAFILKSGKRDFTLWVTIMFLCGFGLYQIWAGSGKAIRFIEISRSSIILKRASLLSPVSIVPGEIDSIDFFPLSIVFHFRTGKKLLLRLGTVNYETNEKIIDELIRFAEENNIRYEVKEETI